MELTFRTATPAERLYTEGQSTQIAGQTGYIGHLRADMGGDGQGFFKTWQSHRESLDTEKFQQEFEGVLDSLVDGRQYSGFLKSRDTMRAYCQEHPESGFHDGFDFGFRADTAQYSYLIRLKPYDGEKNLSISCYRRDWLDRHMIQAEKGIRFITPDYKEKFRILDGGMVRITRPDGSCIDRVCRYIDDCHMEIGTGWDSLFHICQFAEQMERCNNTVIPLRDTLPDKCYAVLPGSDEIIIVKKGEKGYYRTDKYGHDRADAISIVNESNTGGGVTRAQAAAMLAGSMFGWDTPAADPQNYDGQGQPIKPRRPDRGDAR